MTKPLISVCCVAYNHAPYIRQALDSVLMQETKYPFEIIVHDDVSTDGTTDIIREYANKYPEMIRPLYERENQYSQGRSIVRDCIYPNVRGKYIALLDCDDYWASVDKLQKQVSYMEMHPECSGTFHAANWLIDDKIIKNDQHSDYEFDATPQQVIAGGREYCATASFCFRTEYENDWPAFRTAFGKIGDYPLQVLLALRGKFHYFPEIMSSYRFLRSGSWSQNMQKDKTAKVRDLKAAINGFQLLDAYTHYQYSTEIYYRVSKHRCDLYVLDEISFNEVKESFRHMRWGYMKLSRMRRCYDRFLRRYIPGIKQKY